jgi:anti-sigma regulatory factor (Ser/Thr protein kinase)
VRGAAGGSAATTYRYERGARPAGAIARPAARDGANAPETGGPIAEAELCERTDRRFARLRAGRAGHCHRVASASWSVPALAEEVGGLRHAAVAFAHDQGVADPPLEGLRLAISEAVTNAVIHAFRTRERPGTITVTVDVSSAALVEAVVRDDGMGMSARSDSPGLGLGLGLIGSVADSVEFRAPADGVGFELLMSFRCGG